MPLKRGNKENGMSGAEWASHRDVHIAKNFVV